MKGGRFFSDEAQSRHMLKAARLKQGDCVEIFDGQGLRHSAVIDKVDGDIVCGTVGSALPSPSYKLKLTLCFSVLSRKALESALEHCTEAGVDTFQPVISSRVQFDLLGDWERRAPRLRQIIISASKQCGRGRLPALERPRKFDDLLSDGRVSVVAAAPGKTSAEVALAIAGETDVRLFVGPEGGFTQAELEFAVLKKAVPLSLGKYTLRAETACLAGACALLNTIG